MIATVNAVIALAVGLLLIAYWRFFRFPRLSSEGASTARRVVYITSALFWFVFLIKVAFIDPRYIP